ncbi:MAG: hypothetical protein OXH04_03210 [Acidobacteria bacterium]|nr:hypothetical protein [Acidobacteriota bacterium]
MQHAPARVRVPKLAALVALGVLAAGAEPGAQEGVITRTEALALAYPDARVTRDRIILTSEQMVAVAALARVGMQGRIFPRYVAREDGVVVGRAYIDTHIAKTERQSLLISLEPDGRVKRVDVTVFFEPAQYMAPSVWLRQFDGQVLHEELAVRRGIRPIAGASFTGRAISNAVRRVLALDQVLEGRASGDPAP